MNEVELLENLLESAAKITYDNQDELEVMKTTTEMIIRKLFGDGSHYIVDLNNIFFSPLILVSNSRTDWRSPFESGLKQFRNLIKIMIEDKKLSSNYETSSTTEFIAAEHIPVPEKKELKEIQILIASPSDVIRERELLLDKLETKFRRDNYEKRCGARIIVTGWEVVASQSGYAQDIINSDLVKKSNIILAIFRHKLGSPTIDLATGTDRSPSGTAEELLYAIRNNSISNPLLGMAYFYTNAPIISLDSVDFKQTQIDWDRLKEFQNEITNEILYKSYKHEEEILDIACDDICKNIIKYFSQKPNRVGKIIKDQTK